MGTPAVAAGALRPALPSTLRSAAYGCALAVALVWIALDAALHGRSVLPLNFGEVGLLLALAFVGLLPSKANERNRVRRLDRSSRLVGTVFVAVLVTTCLLPAVLLLEALGRFASPSVDGVLTASVVDSAAIFLVAVALIGEELFG